MTDRRIHPVIVPHGTELPPPRPGVRYLPVKVLGIVIADDDLRDRVDRFCYWPMIVLALLVLPLFLVEFMERPEGWLQLAMDIGFGLIWTAFLVEFIVKIAIAESRVEYLRRNWLDVIIIVLPFLRIFRVGTALARTTRVFRLRGVAMKVARYLFTIIIGLEATDRLLQRIGLRKSDHRPDPAKMTRHALMDEVKRLRKREDAWEEWHAAHEKHVQRHGGACYIAPPPEPADEQTVEGELDPGSAAEA